MTSSSEARPPARRKKRAAPREVPAQDVGVTNEADVLAQMEWEGAVGDLVPSDAARSKSTDHLELERYARSYAEHYGLGSDPVMPTPETLARWVAAEGCPPDALAESTRRLEVLFGAPCKWSWSVNPEGPGAAMGVLVENEGLPSGPMAVGMGIGDVISRYTAPGAPRPGHPLAPIMRAWFDSPPMTTQPERREQGIMPAPLAVRTRRRDRAEDYLPGFEMPPVPGLIQVEEPDTAYLPGLEPEGPPTPALILALFDAAGGESLSTNGPATTAVRIFVEGLLSVPTGARDGRLHETPHTIREIAGVWLQWNLRNYRVSGAKTGRALQKGLAQVHNMMVPIGDAGWYRPLMVSAGNGFSLDAQVILASRLPPGQVGPPVDRKLLRTLGLKAGPSYRAYLSLVFDWDTYGGHKGRLVLPTRPVVKRDSSGNVLGADGQVLTNRDREPVLSHNDKRAIRTGEREANPDRARYRTYGPDDVAFLVFGPWKWDAARRDPHKAGEYRRRARKAVEVLEQLAGCTVERLGANPRNGYLPWRIMPADTGWGVDIPGVERAAR